MHDESKESIAFAKQLKTSMKDHTYHGCTLSFVMQPTNVYPSMDSIVTSFLYNPVVEDIAHVPMSQLKIACNSCQPSTVHVHRHTENIRELPRMSLLDHAPTARPNVRTAVCNEKVPGKEDMWLPQRTLRKSARMPNGVSSKIRRIRVLTSTILQLTATVPTAKGKNSDCCAESQCFGAAERRMLSEGLCSEESPHLVL